MVSDAQLKANQQNSLRGGVKSEGGKLTSRKNAIKHGFFSKIVNDYDKMEHQDFCSEIHSHLNPSNILEEQLVEILLSNLLSYRRVCLIESEHIKKTLDPTVVKDLIDFDPSVTAVEHQGYEPEIGCAVLSELEKFQRYKVSAVNLIIKTHHELERLRRLGQGEYVKPPVAVDLNVDEN